MAGHGDAAERQAIWLDCDPGHDDALAMLLALFAPAIDVLGISTTHGNTTGRNTFVNAAKLLTAFGIAPGSFALWCGSDVPLVRPGRVDVDIHGSDGLGGVECLPDEKDRTFLKHIEKANGGSWRAKDGPERSQEDALRLPEPDVLGLITHQVAVLQERVRSKLPPISIVATGPLTNVALLIRLCPPELFRNSVKQISIMGGAAGVPGNRGPLAEWNILVDPEAASIVFDTDVPVVMAGLNATHQAIFTQDLYTKLMQTSATNPSPSPLQRLVASAMTFFAGTYRDVFHFTQGPPVHDLLAVAWVLDPSLFFSGTSKRSPARRYNVTIDTRDGPTCGATIVDFHDQTPIDEAKGWGRGGRNAIVLENVDTSRLWPLFFAAISAVERAEAQT